MFEQIFNINNLKETKILAEKLFKKVPKETVFCLTGELGSGKTQFTKFLAKAMNIQDIIISPTFLKMKIYKGKKNSLLHIDAYKLNLNIDITEFFDNFYEKYVVIEWSEIFKNKLNSFFVVYIDIKYLNKNKRIIKIKTQKNLEIK